MNILFRGMRVRCDQCHKETVYVPLRFQERYEIPSTSFYAVPLFYSRNLYFLTNFEQGNVQIHFEA